MYFFFVHTKHCCFSQKTKHSSCFFMLFSCFMLVFIMPESEMCFRRICTFVLCSLSNTESDFAKTCSRSITVLIHTALHIKNLALHVFCIGYKLSLWLSVIPHQCFWDLYYVIMSFPCQIRTHNVALTQFCIFKESLNLAWQPFRGL